MHLFNLKARSYINFISNYDRILLIVDLKAFVSCAIKS